MPKYRGLSTKRASRLTMLFVCHVTAFLLSWRLVVAQLSFEQQCLSLNPDALASGSTLEELEFVQKGRNLTFPDNDPSCNRPSQVIAVDLCRIALSIPTSNRSGFTFELWLPQQWTGRFLGTGNGGLDGCQSSSFT